MSTKQSKMIVSRDHYTYVTRSVIRLFNQGTLPHVTDVIVEPEYGYMTRLSYDDGTFRVTYGNELGLNSAAACDLAKDKGFTKFMLRKIGVNTPKGKEFLLPWWVEQIGHIQARRGNTNIHTTDEAVAYIEQETGYPVYIKPISGSKGSGVMRVDTRQEAENVFESFNTERVRLAVVEEAINMPDYRVVVLDGELISAYLRKPLAVIGDGIQSIEALINEVQEQYILQGRDTLIDVSDLRIAQTLQKQGLNLSSILEKDVMMQVTSISNLSAGGASEDVTKSINNRWKELAADIAKNFNLRLCGVDLACADITKADSDYSVLEVNAAPGLDHFALSGEEQQKIVDDLYSRVLNAYPTHPK